MTINEQALLSWSFDPIRFSVTPRDAIIYGLGLGLGSDPTDPRQLRHIYENGLVAFPTMPVVLGSPGMWFARAGLDARKVLHGSQSVDVLAPLPLDTPLVALNRVSELVDLGAEKGAVVEVSRQIETADGVPVARLVSSYFCRGDGGFGGSRSQPSKRPPVRPDRAPDDIRRIPTLPQAALLYRLNGDLNPLHADPAFASKVGYERPILHGLCSFGMCARALVDSACGGNGDGLKAISARMSRPVFPGEVLDVEIWCDGEAVQFEARVAERDVVVISGGTARIGDAA